MSDPVTMATRLRVFLRLSFLFVSISFEKGVSYI